MTRDLTTHGRFKYYDSAEINGTHYTSIEILVSFIQVDLQQVSVSSLMPHASF